MKRSLGTCCVDESRHSSCSYQHKVNPFCEIIRSSFILICPVLCTVNVALFDYERLGTFFYCVKVDNGQD